MWIHVVPLQNLPIKIYAKIFLVINFSQFWTYPPAHSKSVNKNICSVKIKQDKFGKKTKYLSTPPIFLHPYSTIMHYLRQQPHLCPPNCTLKPPFKFPSPNSLFTVQLKLLKKHISFQWELRGAGGEKGEEREEAWEGGRGLVGDIWPGERTALAQTVGGEGRGQAWMGQDGPSGARMCPRGDWACLATGALHGPHRSYNEWIKWGNVE